MITNFFIGLNIVILGFQVMFFEPNYDKIDKHHQDIIKLESSKILRGDL